MCNRRWKRGHDHRAYIRIRCEHTKSSLWIEMIYVWINRVRVTEMWSEKESKPIEPPFDSQQFLINSSVLSTDKQIARPFSTCGRAGLERWYLIEWIARSFDHATWHTYTGIGVRTTANGASTRGVRPEMVTRQSIFGKWRQRQQTLRMEPAFSQPSTDLFRAYGRSEGDRLVTTSSWLVG